MTSLLAVRAATGICFSSSSSEAACAEELVPRPSTTVSWTRRQIALSSWSDISGHSRSAIRRGVVARMSISVLNAYCFKIVQFVMRISLFNLFSLAASQLMSKNHLYTYHSPCSNRTM